jgi:hypothetical protein
MAEWRGIRDQPNPRAIADGARELSGPILGLLESCLVAADPGRHADILRTLMAPDTGYPLDGLVHLLQAAYEGRPRSDLQKLGLSTLHAYCAERLSTLLLQPVRRPDDWSIAALSQCTCRFCRTLAEFLRDPARRHCEWPLAKDQRAHIHRIIDSHDLPVSHVTRRVGRPFTLVLTKTEAVLQREAAERARWDRDLKWLTNMASAF